MKFHHSFLILLCGALIASTHAGPRNSFAGKYEGKWGQPRGLFARDFDTNEIIEGGFFKADIMLRVPSGSGRRNGKIDARGAGIVGPGENPILARLLTDFAEPEIRRGGRKAIYSAVANWKLAQVLPTSNIPGTLRLKIIKRGSGFRIKRGNLQLFIGNDPQPSLKYTGQIRARKR